MGRKQAGERFVHFPEARERLAASHDAWVKLLDHQDNSRDWFSALSALRAHCAYLGACRLALSAQAVESYMVARGCIEAALYGVYLHKHPELTPVWRDRHKDAASMKGCRDTFKAGPMLELLKSIDGLTDERIEKLYSRTIDYGGHPNERAPFQTTRKTEGARFVDVRTQYLSREGLLIAASLKTVAQARQLAL